ncbi:hypothetical protein SAMN05660473_02540 [Arthrobacter sp. 49Tsu3.1M3]|jgi:hypothetical protein|uniref:hypothetical protein n=1 Tax=Arthrobacter sp. 49Tsu3.1M3 TaxID=1279029 RepID=UPI0009D524BF|nr:hypothetical protein [Arthrobacter sp. 49Tsu3.1M3]SKB82344.1 hypothetical protein SAMN05660473_02540 [Arthrobacter sp. 49Tsu3.1M3]
MPRLIAPDVIYHTSWLEASAEFDGAHRDGAGAEDWPLEELRPTAIDQPLSQPGSRQLHLIRVRAKVLENRKRVAAAAA